MCKKIGADPTSIRADGTPYFTLPVIFDPNTNTTVSDSIAIVRYLDKTYPGTPLLIPPETDAFHAALQDLFNPLIVEKLAPLLLPHSCIQLNPSSEEYFRRTREARFGKLEEWSPRGSAVREGHLETLKASLTKVASFLNANGSNKTFFMGDRICYADFILAGWLIWVKRVLGAESQEWLSITTWSDGKWAKLISAVEKYEVVV